MTSNEDAKRLALLDSAEFTTLFVEELGWDRPKAKPQDVTVDDRIFRMDPVAEYRGVRVWACSSTPDRRTQRAIDAEMRKNSAERLVIFHDRDRQQWKWPLSSDSQGKGSSRIVTHEHLHGNRTEALLQRLQLIEIELGEQPSVVDIVGRMRRAFDAETVTKSFYKRFAETAKSLSGSISGVSLDADRDWYAALLLNRLMFIYFMQRKGFMDSDVEYLQNRLHRVKEVAGPDKFYEFYSEFLLPLFHDGLGSAQRPLQDTTLSELIGDVPYVNGGIFSTHALEQTHEISIPDDAFESVFRLFDQYQWHLDDRPTGRPNEINPDVLGYIFEQFINHRAETDDAPSSSLDKGAYYTAEDISSYMTTSTLIPVFLDHLSEVTGRSPWEWVSENIWEFVWESVRSGIDEPFSERITESDDYRDWSERPGAPWGHPGESWLEIRDRRVCLDALTDGAEKDRIRDSNDAVSANIDLESIAIKVIDQLESPEETHQAWTSLTGLKIIDPTCGSGAFLFSALKQLQVLYQAVLDSARLHAGSDSSADLQRLLEDVDRHPSEDYYILKHAALNNLYGVDIMPEAAEIARLRLFLALVAAIDDRRDLEPLPDLDFNIKSGNTLVGAARAEDIQEVSGQLFDFETANAVTTQAEEVRTSYELFREAQENEGIHDVASIKRQLTGVLNKVRTSVNHQWHQATAPSKDYETWVRNFQPFHWFIEFPEVFASGGFDVVIGNPPYVAATRIRRYTYEGFRLSGAPDIYAPVIERAAQITKSDGRLSMIVPLNLTWGPRYQELRDVLTDRFSNLWVSTYGIIPARLFPGLEIRNTILIAGPGEESTSRLRLSMYRKWNAEARPHLFPTLRYFEVDAELVTAWPKVGHERLMPFVTKSAQSLAHDVSARATEFRVGFKKIGGYWLSVFRTDPPAMDGERNPVPQKVVSDLYFRSDRDANAALAIMASRACFMWWVYWGDEFNSPAWTFTSFPISIGNLSEADQHDLAAIGEDLDRALNEPGNHILWTPYAGAWQGNFDMNFLRHITDRADRILLPLLGIESAEAHVDFNTEYANFMKIGRDRPGTVRGPVPDRDRT